MHDMTTDVFVKPNDQSQTCLSFGMARPDERSMSRVEFTPTMPCKEEGDKVKTKDEIQHNDTTRYKYIPKTTDFRLKTIDIRPKTTDFRLKTIDFRPKTAYLRGAGGTLARSLPRPLQRRGDARP